MVFLRLLSRGGEHAVLEGVHYVDRDVELVV
jgi:hypothetical protein